MLRGWFFLLLELAGPRRSPRGTGLGSRTAAAASARPSASTPPAPRPPQRRETQSARSRPPQRSSPHGEGPPAPTHGTRELRRPGPEVHHLPPALHPDPGPAPAAAARPPAAPATDKPPATGPPIGSRRTPPRGGAAAGTSRPLAPRQRPGLHAEAA